MHRPGIFRKYAYAWLTIDFFLVAFGLHWLFGWYAYQDEAAQHVASADARGHLVEMMRDTMENWQSEFLQLIWQVVGLAYFLYVGSPASKENDDRLEAKVDALIRNVGGEEGARLIEQLDEHYPAHARPFAAPRPWARARPAGREQSAARGEDIDVPLRTQGSRSQAHMGSCFRRRTGARDLSAPSPNCCRARLRRRAAPTA